MYTIIACQIQKKKEILQIVMRERGNVPTYRLCPIENQLLKLSCRMCQFQSPYLLLQSLHNKHHFNHLVYTIYTHYWSLPMKRQVKEFCEWMYVVLCVFTHVCVWGFKTHESSPLKKILATCPRIMVFYFSASSGWFLNSETCATATTLCQILQPES